MSPEVGVSKSTIEQPRVVSEKEWIAARKELLAKEKALTRQRDALAEERRRLPWVRVEKNYAFDTASGKKSFTDLFAGKSQLAIYHFMFGPDWGRGARAARSLRIISTVWESICCRET